MTGEPFAEQAEQIRHAEGTLRRQQEALTAAAAAAAGAVTAHQTDDGHIRVVVNGRFRIEELYLSEYALRSPDMEQQVVATVNQAIAAAQAAYAEQLKEHLDVQTAALLDAADDAVHRLRNGADDLLRPGRGDR